MQNQYRIVGDKKGVDRFFEVTRAFQSGNPMYESVVMSSFPLGGDDTLGMCIQLSDKTRNVELVAQAIACGVGVTLLPLTDKEYELASKVRTLGIELHNCREWIRETIAKNRRGHLQCTGMDWIRAERLL